MLFFYIFYEKIYQFYVKIGTITKNVPIGVAQLELNALIRGSHHRLEAKEKRRITQREIAQRIGVSHRTYIAYQQGKNAPLAMKALLNLLALLDDSEILTVVRDWKVSQGQE